MWAKRERLRGHHGRTTSHPRDAFDEWMASPDDQTRAFQRWRRFKEGFDPELIARAASETPGEVSRIADPFSGSGTTAVAAQLLGLHPEVIEVNPFLADLGEAKLAPVDTAAVREALEKSLGGATDREARHEHAPPTLVEPGRNGRYVFPRSIADRIASHLARIEAIADPGTRRLLRVMLGASLGGVSNTVVSGKGRRYRHRWRERERTVADLDAELRKRTGEALEDIEGFCGRRGRRYTMRRGDARDESARIGEQDVVVSSPPYPNSFDYTDIYNVELWALGYLRSRSDNRTLRLRTLRSHVQITRTFGRPVAPGQELAATVEALGKARERLWNRHIPEMIGAYAADLEKVLKGLSGCLRARGRVYLVVGNSRYAGIEVRVERIVGEMSDGLGLRNVATEPIRTLQPSPQQHGNGGLVEHLVVLEKKGR